MDPATNAGIVPKPAAQYKPKRLRFSPPLRFRQARTGPFTQLLDDDVRRIDAALQAAAPRQRTPRVFRIWAELVNRANNTTGVCQPRPGQLEQALGISSDTLARAVRILKTAGLLWTSFVHDHRTGYRIGLRYHLRWNAPPPVGAYSAPVRTHVRTRSQRSTKSSTSSAPSAPVPTAETDDRGTARHETTTTPEAWEASDMVTAGIAEKESQPRPLESIAEQLIRNQHVVDQRPLAPEANALSPSRRSRWPDPATPKQVTVAIYAVVNNGTPDTMPDMVDRVRQQLLAWRMAADDLLILTQLQQVRTVRRLREESATARSRPRPPRIPANRWRPVRAPQPDVERAMQFRAWLQLPKAEKDATRAEWLAWCEAS